MATRKVKNDVTKEPIENMAKKLKAEKTKLGHQQLFFVV